MKAKEKVETKTWKKWTEEEIEKLIKFWPNATYNELEKEFPNRSYNSLMTKAQCLKIKCNIKRNIKGSFNFLNNLTKDSIYWWGFIMADGHLSNRGELTVQSSIKDENHIKKLANELHVKIKRYIIKTGYKEGEFCKFTLQQKQFGEKWLTTFKINSPKTYTVPDLSLFYNKVDFINFFIGFVDGDGCIWLSKNWPNLKIEIHKNWINELIKWSELLNNFYCIKSKVKLSKRGTAELIINNKNDLKELYKFSQNLPFMERKWEKLAFMSQ